MKRIISVIRLSMMTSIAAVIMLFVPQESLAATSHNWCVRWGTSFWDSGVGEDYGTGSSWYGRGAKVVVTPPGGPSQIFYASVDTGCFSFVNAATSNYIVRILAETRIGGSNNIRVRSFSSQSVYENWLASPVDDNLESWIFLA